MFTQQENSILYWGETENKQIRKDLSGDDKCYKAKQARVKRL